MQLRRFPKTLINWSTATSSESRFEGDARESQATPLGWLLNEADHSAMPLERAFLKAHLQSSFKSEPKRSQLLRLPNSFQARMWADSRASQNGGPLIGWYLKGNPKDANH